MFVNVEILKCKIITIYFQEPKATILLKNLTQILTVSQLLGTLT